MPVPWSTKEELLWLSGNVCSIDGSDHTQMHHIDGNRNNNNPDNWVILCSNCHDTAQRDLQIKGSTMANKLTIKRLKLYRTLSIEAHFISRNIPISNLNEAEEIPTTSRTFENDPQEGLIENTKKWLCVR